MKKYLQLSDIDAFVISDDLSNTIWDIVSTWDYFAKDTLGKQFVRCVDSISANIAEGFGRYTKKDKIKFYRYSSGSLKEALSWNKKAVKRNLLTEEQYRHIYEELQKIPKELNSLINYTNIKLSK
ncbi:four helix bundle protein [Patescibacteria group bacterium]|nr:four helix bundle protein [Patescibacteria group bacterium]